MNHLDCDVGIIGAGFSGLKAAAALAREGLDVRCLEATDRVGGRILTVRDPGRLPIWMAMEAPSTVPLRRASEPLT